jgi:hypothetical protein
MDDLKNDRRIMASDRLLDHVIVRHERFQQLIGVILKMGALPLKFCFYAVMGFQVPKTLFSSEFASLSRQAFFDDNRHGILL